MNGIQRYSPVVALRSHDDEDDAKLIKSSYGEAVLYADHQKIVSSLEAELARLQWQPITPENLPKVGDELTERSGRYVGICDSSSERRTYAQWRPYAWTHRRPINPPKETAE